MSERFNQLVSQHRNLRARCAQQRRQLGETAQEIEGRLGGVDRGVNVVRNLVSRPLLIIGGIAILSLIGPRRVLRLASRGAMVYATARRLMNLRF